MFAWLGRKLAGMAVGKVVGSAGKQIVEVGAAGLRSVGKAFEDPGDLAEARKFGSPSENCNGVLRRIADAINMMVRPTLSFFIMIMVAGELMGEWHISTEGIDADLKDWFEWTMSFYFGQRAIVHDVPKLIKNLRGAFAKGEKKDD